MKLILSLILILIFVVICDCQKTHTLDMESHEPSISMPIERTFVPDPDAEYNVCTHIYYGNFCLAYQTMKGKVDFSNTIYYISPTGEWKTWSQSHNSTNSAGIVTVNMSLILFASIATLLFSL